MTKPGDDEAPGVPGFRTWTSVYVFVLGCFFGYIVLLAAFTWLFA